MNTIKSWKLSISWSDDKSEGLAVHLPEYLVKELQIYFCELEELRAVDEDYDFIKDKEVTL